MTISGIKISKSDDFGTIFATKKSLFCSTGFLFCHLDTKIHLQNQIKQGAMSTLPFTSKSILSQKKNYKKLKYFHHAKI
jgi:hypothetical protein